MTVKPFSFNMLQENTYIVSDDTRECVVIDCGAYYDAERQAVVQYIRDHRLKPVHLLCTHGHLDHCFGNDTLYDAFGLRPELHAADAFLARDMAQQAATFFGMSYDHPSPPLAPFLSPGQQVAFGTHHLEVLHTPGHTPGGLSFYCPDEHVVFTGDTLFRMSVGRTDFERGSWQDLMHSLRTVLSPLPDATTVYPGHGPHTTIGEEKRDNPYLR